MGAYEIDLFNQDLYAHGANDFLLHNLFRFGVGGVTIEHYVRGIKAHLTSPEAGG